MNIAPTTLTLVAASVLTGVHGLGMAGQGLGPIAVYNEAVRVVDGKRVVELPPKRSAGSNKKPRQDGPHMVIETPSGLMDCTNMHFDPDSCQPTSLGKEKQHRAYVVKVRGRWMACPRRDVEKLCLVFGSGEFVPLETTRE